ncbi:MAG: CDP-alcohol phosphatidyltransferase family protein [Rhodoluna sp.]
MTSRKEAGSLSGGVFNVPNFLSFLRIALVPVFLWFLLEEMFVSAITVLAIAGLTDFLDGYLARKLNQTTKLGKLLDPVADRLYIFATLLALSATGYVPWWLAGLVILRDLLMLISLPVLASVGHRTLPVHYLGKASTFALLYAFPLLLMGKIFTEAAFIITPAAWAFALWGVALYWWSGFVYLWQLVLLIREQRQSSTNVNVSKRGV